MTLFDIPPGPAGPGEPPRDADARGVEASGAAPGGPLRRVGLLLAYDGLGFRGFAPQPGERTVGGVLYEALGRMTRVPVRGVCAGRTDAGVHAHGQVVHVDLPLGALERLGARGEVGETLQVLARRLARQLGPEVVVRAAWVAPPGFDARRDACSRRYRYDLWVARVPDPLRRDRAWAVGPLDGRAVRNAADAFVGEHDFRAFCRRPEDPGRSLRRRVREVSLTTVDGAGALWRIEVEADAFCQRMVRSLVGTLVEVGRGRLRAADVVAMLRDGTPHAPLHAPAHGLCLEGVSYPDGLVPLDTTAPLGAPLASRLGLGAV